MMTKETDLQRRVRELTAVCTALRPDIDDARVLSEWTAMRDQLVAAELELAAMPTPASA
jgi:hypothetical protein